MSRNLPREGMGEIVQTVARWVRGFVLTYGIYVLLYGHITPGGGFEGGVIIACGFILPVLAGGRVDFDRKAAAFLASGGVLLFLAVALAGLGVTGGAFFEFGGHEEIRREKGDGDDGAEGGEKLHGKMGMVIR